MKPTTDCYRYKTYTITLQRNVRNTKCNDNAAHETQTSLEPSCNGYRKQNEREVCCTLLWVLVKVTLTARVLQPIHGVKSRLHGKLYKLRSHTSEFANTMPIMPTSRSRQSFSFLYCGQRSSIRLDLSGKTV